MEGRTVKATGPIQIIVMGPVPWFWDKSPGEVMESSFAPTPFLQPLQLQQRYQGLPRPWRRSLRREERGCRFVRRRTTIQTPQRLLRNFLEWEQQHKIPGLVTRAGQEQQRPEIHRQGFHGEEAAIWSPSHYDTESLSLLWSETLLRPAHNQTTKKKQKTNPTEVTGEKDGTIPSIDTFHQNTSVRRPGWRGRLQNAWDFNLIIKFLRWLLDDIPWYTLLDTVYVMFYGLAICTF